MAGNGGLCKHFSAFRPLFCQPILPRKPIFFRDVADFHAIAEELDQLVTGRRVVLNNRTGVHDVTPILRNALDELLAMLSDIFPCTQGKQCTRHTAIQADCIWRGRQVDAFAQECRRRLVTFPVRNVVPIPFLLRTR